MANTTTVSNNTTNLNNFTPTGVVNIVSGLTNPIYLNVGANQQINAGDVVFQNNDTTYGWIGLPSASVSGNNYTSGVNNQGANNLAIQTIQQYIHNNFAGVSVSYRSAKNTSYGKASDSIGVATGRVKVLVDTNANNSVFNSTAATPVGTPWGVSVGCTNPVANNANGTVNSGLYVVCGNGQNFTGAQYAIGRQALPKAANDPYVYLDLISTDVLGGVQEVATA